MASSLPPQTSWNRGDCGNRPSSFVVKCPGRLRLLGIAVTAAVWNLLFWLLEKPPQTSWNRGDCGTPYPNLFLLPSHRLRLLGIAVTAAS